MPMRTLKNLIARLCLGAAVLLGSGGVSFALPPCEIQSMTTDYHNCFGTYDTQGAKYVGEWKNGNRHGQGTYTSTMKYSGRTANNKYVGEWKNGNRHGQGTNTYDDGTIYVGEWKDDRRNGQGTFTGRNGRIREGIWKDEIFQYAQKVPPPSRNNQKKLELLQKRIAELEKEKLSKAKQVTRRPLPKSGTSGSGFFVSKLGHIVTNQHVVSDCKEVTVGDSALKQVAATVLEADRRNDLALLKISSTVLASAETKSLIQKLGISIEPKSSDSIIPLSSNGLMRSEDVELGEGLLVAGYPYGKVFSDTIKVTKGIVSANRGLGDDTGQFQMDAAVQPGNSGGPIYDDNGNIVGVVVSQLNKMKFAKSVGSIPENVNFGIKASTVRQFLSASGLPTKWSSRTKSMSTKDLAKIAKMQTVMVMCYR
jgi:V8-like Glu-specific endopeptidase